MSHAKDYHTEKEISELKNKRIKKKKEAFETHRNSLIDMAESSIRQFEYFSEIIKIPNFVSAATIASGDCIITSGCSEFIRSDQTRSIRQIYEIFGAAHANTRLTSGGPDNSNFSRVDIHVTQQIGILQNGIQKFIKNLIENKNNYFTLSSPFHAAFINEVIHGKLPR